MSRLAYAASCLVAAHVLGCRDASEDKVARPDARATRDLDAQSPSALGEADTRDEDGGTADAERDATATDVDPEPSDVAAPDGGPPLSEICKAACDNALRVTLAELPADVTAAMRDEITRAMETSCPVRCSAKGSPMSVKCVAEARTALELAACPR